MVDIFYEKICQYCQNINTENCDKNINIIKNKNLIIYKCKTYNKNDFKIKGFKSPLVIFAPRKHVHLREL